MFWPKQKLDDLMDYPDTAYAKLVENQYKAEKGLLELYRNFVSEMLKISLAGVAVLGFLQKFIGDEGNLCPITKYLGLLSMSTFALSAILALFFLYFSAEGYRYYIAGLRATEYPEKYDPEKYVKYRKRKLRLCFITKVGSAILLGLGAIFTVLAIATVLF